MSTHRFDIGDIEYTTTVSYFDPGSPGKVTGPPEDCYPPECWEIEFEDKVDVESPSGETKTIPFDEFVELYAKEYTEGDEDKALGMIEDHAHGEIFEGANDYEP